MAVTLSDVARKQALSSIPRYCAVPSVSTSTSATYGPGSLLEFFLRELAPSVDNAAAADAQVYLRDRLLDLEATCYEPAHGPVRFEITKLAPGGIR